MKVFETKVVTLAIRDIVKELPGEMRAAHDGKQVWFTNWLALESLGVGNVKPGPLVASGHSWVRRDYATCIAREEGAIIAGVQLADDCVDEIGTIPSWLMDAVMSKGVEVPGIDWPVNPATGSKCGWVAYMTQAAKSNDAVLPVVDCNWAARMTSMFPNAGDAVRPGALHTPLRGGYFRVTARVMVCEDDDPRYILIGDGQGLVDKTWAAENKVVFENDPQFRAVLHLDNDDSSKWILGKGTLIPAQLLSGVDLVLPRGTLKHNKGVVLEDGVHEVVMGFGVVNGDEDLAGPIHIGPQVTQWAGAGVVQKAHDAVSRKLGELRERANNVSWLADRDMALRDEEGNLAQFEIIKLFAAVCVAIGDVRLMRSKMIVNALAEWIAMAAYQVMSSLGMYAWRFRAVCDRSLEDGVVLINPKVFRHLFGKMAKGAVATIAVRYPFAHKDEMIAIMVMADSSVRWYQARVNHRTMNRAALDFDGDTFAIFRVCAVVMALRLEVEHLPVSEEKLRQKAAPPSSRAQMIVQSMAAGIGLIDYAIQRWVAVWHLFPALREKAEEVIRELRVELQKAVDSVKKAATANMARVMELSMEAKVKRAYHAYRSIGKSKKFRPFMVYDGTPEDAMVETVRYFGLVGVKYRPVATRGKVMLPSHFFSQLDAPDAKLVPLAAFIRSHEEEVPILQMATLPNKTFAGWIEKIPGKGYDWAEKAVERLYERLGEISTALDAGKISAEFADERRAELFELYRKVWRDKALEMKLGLPEENKEWLESAASALWTAFSRGDNAGFALKSSIPEVVARMLIERKDRIAGMTAVGGGQIGWILGGQQFRSRYMNQDSELLTVEVVDRGTDLAVRVIDGELHKLTNAVVPAGMHRALVSVTGGKSLQISFTGEATAGFFEVQAGEVSEPEWDTGFDYAGADDEYVETDVM